MYTFLKLNKIIIIMIIFIIIIIIIIINLQSIL